MLARAVVEVEGCAAAMLVVVEVSAGVDGFAVEDVRRRWRSGAGSCSLSPRHGRRGDGSALDAGARRRPGWSKSRACLGAGLDVFGGGEGEEPDAVGGAGGAGVHLVVEGGREVA